jgi:hypothetical protein
MLIRKADVKKHLAAKARKYHTPLAIASAASSHSFTLFGTSIKPIVTPAPVEALVPISVPYGIVKHPLPDVALRADQRVEGRPFVKSIAIKQF